MIAEMRFYSTGDGEDPGRKKDFYELITNENIYFQSLFLLIPITQGLPCALKSPILEFNILILIQLPLPSCKKLEVWMGWERTWLYKPQNI